MLCFAFHFPAYSDLKSPIFQKIELKTPDDLIWLSAGDEMSWQCMAAKAGYPLSFTIEHFC